MGTSSGLTHRASVKARRGLAGQAPVWGRAGRTDDMAKALVVVESPAKAKTINKYLGRDFKVLASMGHIRDLPKSKLGVDVEHEFAEQYESIVSRM